MTKKESQTIVVETDHHILETDRQSLREYKKVCKKYKIDLDYLIFEFI